MPSSPPVESEADAAEPEVADPAARTRSWTVGRILAVSVVLLTVVFWAWIFAGGPDRLNPDHLNDAAFAKRTEQQCTDLLERLRSLPNATDAKDANQRADVLDRATDEVQAMVDAIAADAPKTGHDAKPVQGWLKDWRTYIGDRRDFAHRLRHDPKARFYVSKTSIKGATASVDETIEVFATEANHMNNCGTPGDVG